MPFVIQSCYGALHVPTDLALTASVSASSARQPMPLIEQNGEGFQYKLEFWQEGYESDVISEPLDGMDDEFFHDVGASQVYVPYRISLLAVNGRGDAISGASTIRAFTGESGKYKMLLFLQTESFFCTLLL